MNEYDVLVADAWGKTAIAAYLGWHREFVQNDFYLIRVGGFLDLLGNIIDVAPLCAILQHGIYNQIVGGIL